MAYLNYSRYTIMNNIIILGYLKRKLKELKLINHYACKYYQKKKKNNCKYALKLLNYAFLSINSKSITKICKNMQQEYHKI